MFTTHVRPESWVDSCCIHLTRESLCALQLLSVCWFEDSCGSRGRATSYFKAVVKIDERACIRLNTLLAAHICIGSSAQSCYQKAKDRLMYFAPPRRVTVELQSCRRQNSYPNPNPNVSRLDFTRHQYGHWSQIAGPCARRQDLLSQTHK